MLKAKRRDPDVVTQPFLRFPSRRNCSRAQQYISCGYVVIDCAGIRSDYDRDSYELIEQVVQVRTREAKPKLS